MEAQNTLGTPQSILNSISLPYTSSLIQSRVIQDVYSQQGETNDVLGLTKLIFHYLELTSGQIVGLFKDDRLNPKILSTSEPLIKQSLSWTKLKDRNKFALFLQPGQLNTTAASLSEVVLRFICFVNVYLLRMRHIGNSVENI